MTSSGPRSAHPKLHTLSSQIAKLFPSNQNVSNATANGNNRGNFDQLMLSVVSEVSGVSRVKTRIVSQADKDG